jgi:single-strand DNA-binding protein
LSGPSGLLSHHDAHLSFHPAILITEKAQLTLAVPMGMGKAVEPETRHAQVFFLHPGSFLVSCQKALQDAPVAAKAVVYLAHIIIVIRPELVVVGIAAGVIAEFLIASAPHRSATIKTGAFCFCIHPIKLEDQAFRGECLQTQINAFFRIQMGKNRVRLRGDRNFALSTGGSIPFINSHHRRQNLIIMDALRNRVQLIGNLGNPPEIKTTESGTKMARFSMATNDSYLNAKGEKVTETQWHHLVAWGKLAEIVEKYLTKGTEVVVEGRLVSRSYNDKQGNKKYITEVVVNEMLKLGEKSVKEG